MVSICVRDALAGTLVDEGTGLLDPGQGMDQLRRHPFIADGEIPEGALGLRTPERAGRNTDGPQAVPLLSNPIIHRRMPLKAHNRMQTG